jgi:hypothetical protein
VLDDSVDHGMVSDERDYLHRAAAFALFLFKL